MKSPGSPKRRSKPPRRSFERASSQGSRCWRRISADPGSTGALGAGLHPGLIAGLSFARMGGSYGMILMKRRFQLIIILFISLATLTSLRADTQTNRIEALIKQVKSLESATFIRNGREYDSRNAAKFLRAKWQAHRKEIHSAEQFIDKAATRSSTTGRPYMIRFKNGTETSCGKYLSARLADIRDGS